MTNWTHPAGFTISQAVSNARRITQITSSLNDATHPGTLVTLSYGPQCAPATFQDGCAGAGCVQRQETWDYNNRLQPVRIQLGTVATPNANSCLVYNYYQSVANPTSCAIPTQGSANNGSVNGYLYQDTTNPSLGGWRRHRGYDVCGFAGRLLPNRSMGLTRAQGNRSMASTEASSRK